MGGASGGKEGDKQRLLPAKEEEVEEDPNVTRCVGVVVWQCGYGSRYIWGCMWI